MEQGAYILVFLIHHISNKQRLFLFSYAYFCFIWMLHQNTPGCNATKTQGNQCLLDYAAKYPGFIIVCVQRWSAVLYLQQQLTLKIRICRVSFSPPGGADNMQGAPVNSVPLLSPLSGCSVSVSSYRGDLHLQSCKNDCDPAIDRQRGIIQTTNTFTSQGFWWLQLCSKNLSGK